jgi:cytosine/adenosine deaminase-related metal-dependent hydrolase
MRRLLAASAVLILMSTTAFAETWALKGNVLGPNGLEPGIVVITDQRISAVGKDVVPPPGARVVAVPGAILPGFIDLHNHLVWNVFPRWLPGREFRNRYEWQDTAEYDRKLKSPQARLMERKLGCDAEIYAEVKALVGGATSVTGSFKDAACTAGLTRNLDFNSGFAKPQASAECLAKFPPPADNPNVLLNALADVTAYEVFPMEIQRTRAGYYLCELDAGNLRSLIVHLSEGAANDSSAHREYKMLAAQDFLRPGLVLIHGVALAADDLAALAAKQVGLVWSPRSNDELYGSTVNIPAAQKAGIALAIAPDWSPTGSAGMLQEITYAAAHYPGFFKVPELIGMATSSAAKMSRLDDRIGKLAPNYYADITVVGLPDGSLDSLGKTSAADVQLVVVGGQPVYGDRTLLKNLLPGQKTEDLAVCGAAKAVSLAGTAASGRSWADVTQKLQAELDRDGLALATFECN